MTPKQKAFARYVAEGDTLAAAYRKAYSADNMKDASVRNEASKLAANPVVSQTILTLQARAEHAAVVSVVSDREKVLQKLRDLMDNPSGHPSETVALRAADLLGRTLGLYQNKLEVNDKRERTAEEIRSELAARLDSLVDEQGSMH